MTDNDELAAYQAAQAWLEQSPQSFLYPRIVPSIVNLRDLILDPLPPEPEEEREVALNSPDRGPEFLAKRLEELEALDKEEANLVFMSPWTVPLTQIVTNEPAANPQQALEQLQACGSVSHRRVCQYPFKKNDIVYMCKTCQADETCAMCHDCFSHSNHEGHDVAFFHAQEGGCCDCGDPDAWDPKGFCPKHGTPPPSAIPPRRAVCQKQFKKGDIIWLCRTCQADETCAMCHECFNNSDHESHDVIFFHQQQNEGCCDCGDPEAWDPQGFCPNHGPPRADEPAGQQSLADALPRGLVSRVRGVIPSIMDWMVNRLAQSAREGSQRTLLPLSSIESSLGTLGKQGHGMYLVLQADDVHTPIELIDILGGFLNRASFSGNSLPPNLAQALVTAGQLVVWGPFELAVECGRERIMAWLRGDPDASAMVVSNLVRQAIALKRRGLHCRIMTLQELQLEQQAIALMQWMSALACSCDPLCQTVAEYIRPQEHLVPMLEADFILPSRFTKAWYSLLLTLLAVPVFKSNLGSAYCDTYGKLTEECGKGKGILERSAYALSVQFLNRDTYVLDLVSNRDLLSKLGNSLLSTLRLAEMPGSRRMDPNSVVLRHRRYSPCISDLNYVINVKGMKRLVTCENSSFLTDFVSALGLAQCMNAHTWRHWDLGHVEEEDLGWYGAFNLCITLGGIFERILSFDDDEPSPVQNPTSALSQGLLTCEELTYDLLLKSIASWQKETAQAFEPTPFTPAMDSHRKRSASLPFSTVAARYGTALAFRQLPVGQATPFSLHLPLHRFLASCIRELCLRPSESGLQHLIDHLLSNVPERTLDELFFGLMEFPVLVLARAAQVRAGLWRRNGPALSEQVKKYTDATFCRSMRDADVALVQFAVLKRRICQSPTPRPKSDVSVSMLVHLLLHRLGLFDFVGLNKAPNADTDTYEAEVSRGLYPKETGEDDGSKSGLVLPWTYTPARDAGDCRALMEEFLFLLIIIITELPSEPPRDKDDHVDQARSRLRREVIHRLAAGPKTHSELADISLVMPFRDNLLLSEEGKLINPDDATAAMLGKVLENVADRKASGSRLEPDKFVLRKFAWEYYDPSFYHISVESHQTAAESRPVPSKKDRENWGLFGPAMAYVPRSAPTHPVFERLRRDFTADAAVIAIIFKILHMHCSARQSGLVDLKVGRVAYENDAKSEISLARALHLLTLGCYAWDRGKGDMQNWRESGGGAPGSVFFDREEAPSVSDWVETTFLTGPKDVLDCSWYEGEENVFQLVKRLAIDGGMPGNFVIQDPAVQAGAAWLCDFAVKHCSVVQAMVSNRGAEKTEKTDVEGSNMIAKEKANNLQQDFGADLRIPGVQQQHGLKESDFERRKREAKEKAMAKMNAHAANFASAVGLEMESKTDPSKGNETEFERKKRLAKEKVMTEMNKQASDFATKIGLALGDEEETETDVETRKRLAKERAMIKMNAQATKFASMNNIGLKEACNNHKNERISTLAELSLQPKCVLQLRPQCIICSDSEAECFVAFAQGSTVLKGGGGPHFTNDARMVHLRRFAGTYTALCGHAVHSDCGVSYLAKVQQSAGQGTGMINEFRCPLCQRPSNCLVPIIDVDIDWIDTPKRLSDSEETVQTSSLERFLATTGWWVSRQRDDAAWDGQSSFESIGNRDAPLIDSPEHVSGDVTVLKTFMEHLCGIAYAADSSRLGDDELRKNLGEFRHYIIEKQAFNEMQMSVGKEPAKWPSCLFPEDEVSESQLRLLSREKIMSQLLMSIECLVYSACCEAYEARRAVLENSEAYGNPTAGARLSETGAAGSLLSKFGISGTLCDGQLILMPPPSSVEDQDGQPFNGRLGRLRYLCLALMAAAGAFGCDLVQVVLPFPSQIKIKPGSPRRAAIAYPILLGHVLTHVVAAMCVSSGRAIAPGNWADAFAVSLRHTDTRDKHNIDAIAEDCEAFLKLGLLARVLQVLCKELNVSLDSLVSLNEALEKLNLKDCYAGPPEEEAWLRCCRSLLRVPLKKHINFAAATVPMALGTFKGTFQRACLVASGAASAFLSEAGALMQLLVPGIMARYDLNASGFSSLDDAKKSTSFQTLNKLQSLFKIEPIDEMLTSSLVCDVVINWYDEACQYIQNGLETNDRIDKWQAKLFRTEGFRSWDWPLVSINDYRSFAATFPRIDRSPPLAMTPAKKTAPLLGGYCFDEGNNRPCVDALTLSYMDLYAIVGALKPDADRTAVCLICGEALDASGTGECTRHSYICGAGTGIFFLLQECIGLIMFREEGSYIHSIYVDSHGETPRGRPLYLDTLRYEHLRDLWSYHMIKQQVLAERETTQQGVFSGFY